MTAPYDTVFLFDVDNTLLDNDSVIADLRAHIEHEFGAATARRYRHHFEALRSELGYADYLGALQRWRVDAEPLPGEATRLPRVSDFLVDYPFAERLYPDAVDAVRRLGEFGPTVILTDGDVVFQPRKVRRSGLWDAVAGRVLIYIQKERMPDAVQRHYPARHYVMVDDKLRIRAAMKKVLKDRLTTAFPAPGALRAGPSRRRRLPGGRHLDRAHRRFARCRHSRIERIQRPGPPVTGSQAKP